MFPYIWQAISTHPFNFLTLVIALLAALFTGLQAIEARKARRASEESLKSQADTLAGQMELLKQQALASQRSAEAAEASAKASKRFAETGQRAWAIAREVIIKTTIAGPLPSMITINLHNVSATPALEGVARLCWAIWGDPPESLDFSRNSRERKDYVGPGSPCNLHMFIDLEENQMPRLIGKEDILVAFGDFQYKDVFDKPHSTTWCYIYSMSSKSFVEAVSFNEST